MKPKTKPYTLAQLRAALKEAVGDRDAAVELGVLDEYMRFDIYAYALRAKIKERLRDKRRRRVKWRILKPSEKIKSRDMVRHKGGRWCITYASGLTPAHFPGLTYRRRVK